MGKFTKGHKLAKGRPEGSANKVTKETRARMSELLSLTLNKLNERIDELRAGELIELAVFLGRHTVPVPKEDNGDGTTDTKLTITIKPDDLQ